MGRTTFQDYTLLSNNTFSSFVSNVIVMSQRDLISQFSQINVQAVIGLLEVLHSDSGKQLFGEMQTFKADFDPFTIDPDDAKSLFELLKVAQRTVELIAHYPELSAAFPEGMYNGYARIHYELAPWGILLEKVTNGKLPDADDREHEILKAASRSRGRTLIAQKLYEGESA